MGEKKLPVYNVTLGDYDEGMFAISLVKNPAIESNFVYMSEDGIKEEKISFKLSDEEKGEAIGAVLIPDKPILRVMNGQAFYMVFSKEVISQINERMHKYGYTNVFTINHEMRTPAITLLESWIKETDEDKSNAFGFDAPIGTLFVKVKIDSDFIKENIKNGTLRGFSAEIDLSIVKQMGEQKMEFEKMYEKSVEVDGKKLLFNGKLQKGTVLFALEKTDEKETVVPFTGKFKLDNTNYSVVDGLVTEVENIELTLSQKIDSLAGEIKNVKAKLEEMRPKEGDEKDVLLENVNAILAKLEEQSLLAKQKELENKKKEVEEKTMNFSIEAYEAAKKWDERFYKSE